MTIEEVYDYFHNYDSKVYDVAPFCIFSLGIIVYGIAKGIPDYLDIRVKWNC